MLRELDRVARGRGDRERPAAELVRRGGFWLVTWPLRLSSPSPATMASSRCCAVSPPAELAETRAAGDRRSRRCAPASRLSTHRHLGAPHRMSDLAATRARSDAGRTSDEDGRRAARRAPLERIFHLAAEVERWPALLPHYRYVRFVERRRDGGGIVDMSANRPFGVIQWPTWWRSKMQVHPPTSSPVAPASGFAHRRSDDGHGSGVDLHVRSRAAPT